MGSIKFLVSRTSPKNLYQLLQNTSLNPSYFPRNIHSLFSRQFHSSQTATFSSSALEPQQTSASAPGPNTRVPATVITGFLGSGKVFSYTHLYGSASWTAFWQSLIFFSFLLNQSTDTNLNASGFQDTASLFFSPVWFFILYLISLNLNWIVDNADNFTESYSDISTWQADCCHRKWGMDITHKFTCFWLFFNYLFSYEKLLITVVLALKDK